MKTMRKYLLAPLAKDEQPRATLRPATSHLPRAAAGRTPQPPPPSGGVRAALPGRPAPASCFGSLSCGNCCRRQPRYSSSTTGLRADRAPAGAHSRAHRAAAPRPRTLCRPGTRSPPSPLQRPPRSPATARAAPAPPRPHPAGARP